MRLKVLLRSSRNAGQPDSDDRQFLIPEKPERLERIAVKKAASSFNKETQTEGQQRDKSPPHVTLPPFLQWTVLPRHAPLQPAQQAMPPPPLPQWAILPRAHQAAHPATLPLHPVIKRAIQPETQRTCLRAVRPSALRAKLSRAQQAVPLPPPPPMLPPINSGIYTEDEFRKYWGIQRGPNLSNVTKDMLEVADILAEYGKAI